MKRRFRQRGPRTAEEFFAMSEAFRDRWTRVTHVVTKMRTERVSLRQASREFEIDPRTVRRLGGSALRKRPHGPYAARASDKLLRVLVIPEPNALREIATRDSRQATLLAEYWNAVETGDTSVLQEFSGKSITDATGTQVPLLTDVAALDVLADAGVLSFESIYAGTA